ncbi:MAG: protease modulator HflC [Planctomycetota bacterium]
MKNLAVTVFVVLVVAILILLAVSFQVRETQSVVVTRFGEPKRPLTEPGLYWKLPWPIERIHVFDSRLRLYEGVLEETTTRGGASIVVTSYVVWKIGDPRIFLEKVGTVRDAEKHLYSLLRAAQNNVVGRHHFGDFVNANPEKIKFDQIEAEMAEALRQQVEKTFGIEIKTVGIKQLGVSEKVTEAVFARIRADRKAIADAIIAEGQAEEVFIKGQADRKKSILVAAAEARAKAIRGSGDAEAAKYYKMLKDDEDLAIFLRNIEALEKILAERSTIVLSGQSEPFNLLKEMPQLQPK